MALGMYIVFFAVLGAILSTSHELLYSMLMTNIAAQAVLFALVAVIPFLKTKRMSYVDIAWPFGVALIGLHIVLMGDADPIRKFVVGGVYLFIGLRMGVGSIVMGRATGVIFKYEFPRYKYRRVMLAEEGAKYPNVHMLIEVVAQGFANMTVLALPGFIIATSSLDTISVWELAGLGLWLVAYITETTADAQKLLFISKTPKGVCNIGLWKYSRHPNYFSEWLVWSALVVATVPSWLALEGTELNWVWLVLGFGAVCASVMLYLTLVYLTGAKPAEYFSVQKRAGYKEYQQTTNMFFPWFPK